jgi:hypothetical protein
MDSSFFITVHEQDKSNRTFNIKSVIVLFDAF